MGGQIFEFSLKVKLPSALKLMALSCPNKSANYLTLDFFKCYF